MLKWFNRDYCPGAILTNATMDHITVHEMDFLNKTYGDVLVIQAGSFCLLGDYERGGDR